MVEAVDAGDEVDAAGAGNEVEGSINGSLLSSLTDKTWRAALEQETKLPYYTLLEKLVLDDYNDSTKEIFPEKNLIFNALNLTPLNQVSRLH